MIIGIIGKKRSGKDTCGDYLVKNHGFMKYSFANPLKRGAMEIFGFTEDEVFGDDKDVVSEKWGVTPRLILQIMGTELFQFDLTRHIPEFEKIGREIWVKRFKMWYDDQCRLNNGQPPNVVICDVRFQHEADAIEKMGGRLVKIHRPDLVSNDSHDSEKEMDGIVGSLYEINNNSSLVDLYGKIETFLSGVN